MKLLGVLLITFYASDAWSQDFDFTCGFYLPSESDFVPLEVGNQWAYIHRYENYAHGWWDQPPEIRMLFEIPSRLYDPEEGIPDSLFWVERELTLEMTKTGTTNNRRDGRRIAKKLGTGALLGNIFGLLSILPLVGDDSGDGIFGIGFFNTWLIGHMAGTSIGVTTVDPHDHFIMPLTGSLVGTVVGTRSSSLYGKGLGWFGILPIFVCPVAFSTIMSELWRTPPEDSRLSINLVPSPKEHLLAVATLHF